MHQHPQDQYLDPQQRRTGQKIAFWALFAYLKLWILDAVAVHLLLWTLAATAIVLVFRRTELGRRPNFVVLHARTSLRSLQRPFRLPMWPFSSTPES